MAPGSLQKIALELYGLRPEEFTAARAAAEKRVRAEGDRGLAAAVKTLRRPAVAAWAVNLLVRERGDLVDQLVTLGDQLRQAQSLLQGDALRDLSRQRRQLVSAVAEEASALAASEGQPLSDAAVRQVEDTLQAALADRSAAEAVRSGVLTEPLSSTGLASVTEVLAVPVEEEVAPTPARAPSGRAALSVVPDADRRRDEAHARVRAAGESVRTAQKAFDKATKKRAKGEAKVLQLEAELEELRRRVAELEESTDAAVERLTELDAALEEAAAGLQGARAEAEAAATGLAELS